MWTMKKNWHGTDHHFLKACVVVAVPVLLAACSSVPAPVPPTDPTSLQAPRPGLMPGYLDKTDYINSLSLLPPPPQAGSDAAKADQEAFVQTRTQEGSARWTLAAHDAHLSGDGVHSKAFECALGMSISQERTPHLNMLMRRVLTDAGLSTYAAKDHYQRPRPFMVNNTSMCTPEEDQFLRKDGSYPSGHAAVGWAWALVLTELFPQRANAILARGYDFGQSRVICGVHWQSDVNAGRVVAAATVARLHANPLFQQQLQAARGEVQSALKTQALAPAQCSAP